MTIDEARKVAVIVDHAMGGCAGCWDEALNDLRKAFPEFKWGTTLVVGHMPEITISEKSTGETVAATGAVPSYRRC